MNTWMLMRLSSKSLVPGLVTLLAVSPQLALYRVPLILSGLQAKSQEVTKSEVTRSRSPNDRVNIRILQDMMAGIPLL